jgi:hypothetical protein
MAGIQDFTILNYGKETTRGTPVAPTRKFYGEGTGVLGLDPGLNFHEGENRGRRGTIARATQQTDDVTLKAASVSGIGFDDMVWPLTQLKGGMTGVGGAADKTWTATPSMTALNNPEAFSVDVGDDVQNWRVQYAMMTSWKLSAALGDVTQLSCALFGQRAIKTAAASPSGNTATKIPGDLWTVKFAAAFASLGAASISTNFLIDWEMEVQTGLVWRHYMDGNLFGAAHVETSIGGTLAMTTESTALAVTEFYDKMYSQTIDYIRLKATGPTLGGTNYSLQFDVPVLYSKVEPIGAEDNGVNLWKIAANLTDDGTNAITPTLVCSLAAIP